MCAFSFFLLFFYYTFAVKQFSDCFDKQPNNQTNKQKNREQGQARGTDLTKLQEIEYEKLKRALIIRYFALFYIPIGFSFLFCLFVSLQ